MYLCVCEGGGGGGGVGEAVEIVSKYFVSLFWKGVYSKRKEFASFGRKTFLLEYTLFQKGLGVLGNKQEDTKLSPMAEITENLIGVSNPLKIMNWSQVVID